MRWTRLFIPTLRENPAATESIGHQCLLRAGYVRQVAPGIYANLFLAERSLGKIVAIVREFRTGAFSLRGSESACGRFE